MRTRVYRVRRRRVGLDDESATDEKRHPAINAPPAEDRSADEPLLEAADELLLAADELLLAADELLLAADELLLEGGRTRCFA